MLVAGDPAGERTSAADYLTWLDLTSYAMDYPVNPATNNPWTLTEINSLQVGVGLYTSKRQVFAWATEVEVIITYLAYD